jgi:hypothetical protein
VYFLQQDVKLLQAKMGRLMPNSPTPSLFAFLKDFALF